MVSKMVACRCLRGLAACCFAIAGSIMWACMQKTEVYSIRFVAKAEDWPGYWFFKVLNFIAFGYNACVCGIPEGSRYWRRVVFLDLIISTLLSVVIGFGWQTYSLFVKGNAAIYANWSPICGGNSFLPIFCLRYLVSLISSTVGSAICYGILVCCFEKLLMN